MYMLLLYVRLIFDQIMGINVEVKSEEGYRFKSISLASDLKLGIDLGVKSDNGQGKSHILVLK